MGWAGERFYLGRNKEVFDAELYTIMRAMGILLKRNEPGKNYTIFSDPTTTIDRVCTDQPGSGHAPARTVIQLERIFIERGCAVTIRWTPAHKGVEGNKITDTYTKWAADRCTDSVDRDYLREAILAQLTRKTTEAKASSTTDWIRRHVKAERRHRPRKGGRIRKGLQRESELPAGASSSSLAMRRLPLI